MLRKLNRIDLKKAIPNVSNIKNLIGVCNARSVSQKIVNHFSKIGQTSNLDLFPNDLKKVSPKRDQTWYVADEKAGEIIAKAISPFYRENVPFFEINPGPCILTKALLRHLNPSILGLVESKEEFSHVQQVQ